MPITDVVQYANMTNSYFTSHPNPDSSKFTTAVLTLNRFGTPRHVYVYFTGNVFENIENNAWQTIYLNSAAHVNTFVEHNIFRNNTSINEFMSIESNVWFTNNTFENIYNPGNRLIFIFPACSFVYSTGMVFRNITEDTTSFGNFWYMGVAEGGNYTIENTIVQDVSTGNNNVIKILDASSGEFILKDSLFDNVETNGGFPIISAGTITGATIQNLTFSNIYKFDSNQISNILMKFDSVSLALSSTILISDIEITNSTVPFFSLDLFADNSTDGTSIQMQNINYHDCEFEFGENLISFSNLFTKTDFYVSISNSRFYNLNFARGGNLFNFEHQFASQLQISDSEFTNLTGTSIKIEALNKQSTSTTNVLMENITVTD
jgi:hypothetical protein